MMDPYTVLGLTPAATPAEADAAYLRRLRLHDPDHQDDAVARAAAVRYRAEIQAAYAAVADATTGASPVERVLTSRDTRATARTRGPLGPRRWLAVATAVLVVLVLARAPVALELPLPTALVCWSGILGVYLAARAYVLSR